MSYIEFTVDHDHTSRDDDAENPLVGWIYFAVQTKPGDFRVRDQGGSPPRTLNLPARKGWLAADGHMYKDQLLEEPFRLNANDPRFNLLHLTYRGTPALTTLLGSPVEIPAFYFPAPSTDTTLYLTKVMTDPDQPVMEVRTKGYAEDVLDAGATGIASVKAVTEADGQEAIGFDGRVKELRTFIDLRNDWIDVRNAEWKTLLGANLTNGSANITGATQLTSADEGKVALFKIDDATDEWFMTTIEDVGSGGNATLGDNAPATRSDARMRYGLRGAAAFNAAWAEISADADAPKDVYAGGLGYRDDSTQFILPYNIRWHAQPWSTTGANQLSDRSTATVFAQLPGAEKDFIVFDDTNGDPGWMYACAMFDIMAWGPEKTIDGMAAATIGNGIAVKRAGAGTPLAIEDGFRMERVYARNFPHSGFRFYGAVPGYFRDLKAFDNGRFGIEYERYGGSSSNAVHFDHPSGDRNNLGLAGVKSLKAYDTVKFTNVKSEGNKSWAETDLSLRGGPNYQHDAVVLDSCDPLSVVDFDQVSHLKPVRVKRPAGAGIVIKGSVPQVNYKNVRVRITGDELDNDDELVGVPVDASITAVTIRDEVNGVVIPNTVSSGHYGPPGFVDGHHSHWMSAVGGSDAATGADTWTKVCTLSPGTTQNTDLCLIWDVVPANASVFEAAKVAVAVRTWATSVNPTAAVVWQTKHGASTQLYNNSFKVVAGAFGTNFEVWMKKRINFCKFTITETARSMSAAGGWRIQYNPSPAWQSAEPTGAVLNQFSTNEPNIGIPSFGTLTNCTGYPIATDLHAATSKTTPVDADEIPLIDSAASNVLKKLTWANLKAGVLAYLATVKVSAVNFITGFTSTATAAGTTTLTVDSTEIQRFTGATTQTVVLPTTGVVAGQRFEIINDSTGNVSVQSSDTTVLINAQAGQTVRFVAKQATPTGSTHWQTQAVPNLANRASAVASSVALRDSFANLFADAFVPGISSTATAAGTTTLTGDSKEVQVFTGSTTQTVVLPSTDIFTAGQGFEFYNESSGIVTINSSAGDLVKSLAAGGYVKVRAKQATPTAGNHWAKSA